MNPQPPEKPPQPPKVDPNLVCSECGAQGAIDFDGIVLCPKCYTEKGSCCPEFGKDDLWAKHDAERAKSDAERAKP